MNLNQLADLAQILEAIFVAGTVFFIWRELRENTRLTKAANTQRLVETSSPFYLQIIQNKEIAELWIKGAENFLSLDEADKYRYRSLINWWLNFYENIYFQWRSRLLDAQYFEAWSQALARFVGKPSFRTVWNDVRSTYEPEFVSFIEEKMAGAVKEAGLEIAPGPKKAN